MRKLFLFMAVLAAFTAVIAPANAQSAFPRNGRWTMDGNLLYAICKPGAYALDMSYCQSYLLAALDTMMVMDRSFSSCMPPRVTTDQLRDVAMRVLRERPEIRHLSGGVLLAQIYQDAWNCQVGAADDRGRV